MPSLIRTPRKIFEKKVRFLLVGCWVDLEMIKYLTSILFLAHTLAQDNGFTIDQDKGKLILTTQNTDKFEKLIHNYFKDLSITHRTSKTKSKIDVYPFLVHLLI